MATRTTLPGSGGTGDVDGSPFSAAAVDKLPGGMNAYAANVTAQATITTVVDVATLTFTAIASRTYIISGRVRAQSTVANDVVRVSLTDGSNTALDVIEQSLPVANVDGWWYFQYQDQPSAGSTTYKLRGLRTAGTGVVTANNGSSGTSPSWIKATDAGPAF